MNIPIEMAEQVLSENILIKKKTKISIQEKQESFSKGCMEGELYITNQHVMFLCQKPMVDTQGGVQKAVRIAAGIATLGWSQVVTGQIDKRKRNKLDSKIDHPYSFVFELSKITKCAGAKSRFLGELMFLVNNDKDYDTPIFVFNHSNKFIEAFEKANVVFSNVGFGKDWEEGKQTDSKGVPLVFFRCVNPNCDGNNDEKTGQFTLWNYGCTSCNSPFQVVGLNNS